MSAQAALRAPLQPNLLRLRLFVSELSRLVEWEPAESKLLPRVRDLVAGLVSVDDWLPDELSHPHPDRYQQYLLHADSQERFSVVSFVWGPGQHTPIHDHTVWGVVGVLRGAELNQSYLRLGTKLVPRGEPERLVPGQTALVSPSIGDVHRVSNADPNGVSVSIHVYGANIGAVERSTYDLDGTGRRFVSGYANDTLPNLWAGVLPS
jgi:3-mercaptopropionate dioxygenase